MINTITNTIKEILGFNKQERIECSIDDEVIDCKDIEHPYLGVPAPVEMPIDPWFVDPNIEMVKTEKQITHEEMLEEAARREEENCKEEFQEPENIHQKMYELATKNWTTVKEFQGGSEVFQEGPGGSMSGTGMSQFR
jgi:hypothetical protein